MKASSLSPDVQAASAAGNTTTEPPTTSGGDVKVTAYTPVDWAPRMTAIKNQYRCGSCWAFTAIGLVEGGLRIKYGSIYSFSEQELVDCCYYAITSVCSSGNGCNGGSSDQALNFMNTYGISMTTAYPYLSTPTSSVRGSCKYNSMTHYRVLNSTAPLRYVTTGSPSALLSSISARPTGVYVDALSWQYYGSGLFNACTYSGLNHGVVAVGYDSAGNYKLRNSWGTSWGEAGHIRIAAGGNPCGILNHLFYTTVI